MDYAVIINEKKKYTPTLRHLCVGDYFRFKDSRLNECESTFYRVERISPTADCLLKFASVFKTSGFHLESGEGLLDEEVIPYRLDSVHMTEI